MLLCPSFAWRTLQKSKYLFASFNHPIFTNVPQRDLLGVIIAIIGAVTVVLASNVSEARLDSDALLRAILSTPFVVYSCVYLVGVLCLATLSEGTIGKTFVFVDVGLCALFGGFTVLSTKALSTLLTLQWIELFTHRISYILLLVSLFIFCGPRQIFI